MKVRFFERAKGLIRLGCSGLAVLLLASASSAATPGWEVQIINVTGTLDTTTKAADLLDGNIGGYGTVEQNAKKIVPVVDLAGGGGNYGSNFPYPNNVADQSMNDFAVRAKANVVIPAGTWSIAFGSDDGGRLAFDTGGINFDSTFGENGAVGGNEVRYEAPRGHAWTGGSFTVAAPTNASIVADMYERGGGDSFEVAIAQGAQTGFGTSAFQLLANGTLGWQVTTNSAAPIQRIQIAGAGSVGKGGAAVDSIETTLAPLTGTPQAGLTHRWYAGTTSNYNAVLTNLITGAPALPAFRPAGVFSQWWSGTDGVTPANTVRYPSEIEFLDPQKFAVEAASPLNLGGYSAVLTGQILFPENGLYKFKDGVDDYTSLKIDLNNDGTFQANEHLINDNGWTSLAGEANGGSPIVSATVSGVSGTGSWLAIEFVASEGGGGDSGMLMWDYDPAKPGGTGIGKGAAKGFPTTGAEAAGAAIGETPANALDAIMVPDTHLRTHGVRAITGGKINASLQAGGIYAIDVHSLNFTDQITVGGNLPASFTKSLNMNGATLEIQSVGDLVNGDSIKIVDAQGVTGTSNLVFPEGTTWETANFATTGEVKILTGGRNIGGGPVGVLGDFDADNDVDSNDLLGFLGAWTGSLNAGNLEDVPGRANLVYDAATGEVTLVPAAGAKIVGFTLGNSAGQLKPGSADEFQAKTPWADVVFDNKATQIGGSDLTFQGTTSAFSLGAILPAGMDAAGLQGFLSLANYSGGLGTAAAQFDLVVVAVPEPGTLALLGLGVLGFVNSVRRRRS